MLQTIKTHHNVSNYFKQFADKAELVYFGNIISDDDAHIYKGASFAPNAKDAHYTHGTRNDYDLTVFTRRSTHRSHSNETALTEWTVCSIHLKTSGLPHLLLDSQKHEKAFYQSLFLRFPRLRKATQMLANLNASAGFYFDLYALPEHNMTISVLLDDMLLQRLISSFAAYNVEIDDDMLFVSKRGNPISAHELDKMLTESLWLAEIIENRARYASSVQ